MTKDTNEIYYAPTRDEVRSLARLERHDKTVARFEEMAKAARMVRTRAQRIKRRLMAWLAARWATVVKHMGRVEVDDE